MPKAPYSHMLENGLLLVPSRGHEPESFEVLLTDSSGCEIIHRISCPGPDAFILAGFIKDRPISSFPELIRLIDKPDVLEFVDKCRDWWICEKEIEKCEQQIAGLPNPPEWFLNNGSRLTSKVANEFALLFDEAMDKYLINIKWEVNLAEKSKITYHGRIPGTGEPRTKNGNPPSFNQIWMSGNSFYKAFKGEKASGTPTIRAFTDFAGIPDLEKELDKPFPIYVENKKDIEKLANNVLQKLLAYCKANSLDLYALDIVKGDSAVRAEPKKAAAVLKELYLEICEEYGIVPKTPL